MSNLCRGRDYTRRQATCHNDNFACKYGRSSFVWFGHLYVIIRLMLLFLIQLFIIVLCRLFSGILDAYR